MKNDAAAKTPLIRLLRLRKQYRTSGSGVQTVLQGIDLSIDPGEFVAIMGASGSGKSTLMNILGCLDQPTSGDYLLDGANVAELDANQCADLRCRLIGFVFQNFNLLPRVDVRDNVALPLLYAGFSRAERQLRATEMLRRVGLESFARRFPGQLSGGQQQRIAIARALVNQPSLLLADEPTGNLDSATSEEIMAIFKALNEQEGITLVLVTHEPDIARYAKRLIRLKDGQVVEDHRYEAVS